MKGHFLLLFLSVMLVTCQKDYNKNVPPYRFIPKTAHVVLKINAINDFIGSIENQDILSEIFDKELSSTIEILKLYNTTRPIYVVALDDANDYLILTDYTEGLFAIDSIPHYSYDPSSEFEIDKIEIDSTILYSKTFGNLFATSNNFNLLKHLDYKNENTEISRLIESTNNTVVSSLIFKSSTSKYNKLLFNSINQENDNLIVLDLDYTDKSLQYNGIITSQDSIKNVMECFKNVLPQKIMSPEVIPSNINSLVSITYDDFSVFNKNCSFYFSRHSDSIPTFLNYTNEIALIDDALILHALDPKLIIEALDDKKIIETFRAIDIMEFTQPDFFESRLKPFISFNNANYLCVYNNFIIFSDTADRLKTILTSVLNNMTLSNAGSYIDICKKLSNEASLFFYKNSNGLSEILDSNIEGYNANAVQLIYEDHYAHINGILQKYKKRSATHSVIETHSISLDAEIIVPPQTVKNHITEAQDIVVQDANNTLYLVSSSGNILWKKQLHGKILGEVNQIDMYKNGRLQLVFATSNRVYVLDRNGNDVALFPLKFKDPITQPLSVFDYDKRKDYRLLVTQGRDLLMFDAKGKTVSGFNYINNNSDIITQPKHFRSGSKDYIVFAAGETLKILSRQGNVRIDVKDKISFSGNEVFFYNNKFTTSNTLGQLVQIDIRGRLSTKNLNLTTPHNIETTSKTLVTLTDNKLSIKSRTIDLDFGDYTSPRIFYLNDKIYVTTTDLQSKKVYLFDSQAKHIPNFPVFGTSQAVLEKLDKDKGLELITQGDTKTLIIYKLN